jgi:Cys-tRNA(Pro)/Cys-tRNA(Cys) deacylase
VSLPKTNAARMLEAAGLPFELDSYEVDEEHLDGVTGAQKLGVSPDIVFKTLVAQDSSGEHLVFCLPAASELDLKKAARACGTRGKVDLLPLKELTPLTGYLRGGCSPIGMKKKFRTWIEELALAYPLIYVCAGQRGLQFKIRPEDLAKACEAEFADLV